MKSVLLLGIASLCFAGADPNGTTSAMGRIENAINQRLTSNINEPYDLLGPARGTYLDGYGAVFTVAMNVLVIPSLSIGPPFGVKLTAADVAKFHERKVHKISALKDLMRELMVSASQSLNSLGPDDKIVMEAFLFNYSWEDSRNIPSRIKMTVKKQKLIDAVNRHATSPEMAALFEEQTL